MNNEVKECMYVAVDVISLLNELLQLESDDSNISYEDVLTDLKWDRNVLNTRIMQLKG